LFEKKLLQSIRGHSFTTEEVMDLLKSY